MTRRRLAFLLKFEGSFCGLLFATSLISLKIVWRQKFETKAFSLTQTFKQNLLIKNRTKFPTASRQKKICKALTQTQHLINDLNQGRRFKCDSRN